MLFTPNDSKTVQEDIENLEKTMVLLVEIQITMILDFCQKPILNPILLEWVLEVLHLKGVKNPLILELLDLISAIKTTHKKAPTTKMISKD